MEGLGLDKRMVRTNGCVFGVGSIPVKVLGDVEVYVKIPNESARTIRIQTFSGHDQPLTGTTIHVPIRMSVKLAAKKIEHTFECYNLVPKAHRAMSYGA